MFFQDKSLKIKLSISLILAFFFSLQVQAQQELMLHSLQDVWHSNSTNPAFFPENKRFIIGLPGIGLDAAHSGDVSYKDIFVKDGDRTLLNFSNALAKLDPTNTVFFEQRIETASIGLRLPGKIWLQAGHANRLSGSITYPKTLPALIWEGNAQYIGQTVDIGLQTDIADWNEWSVGLAKGFGNFRVGVRGKYLTGVTSLRTDKDHGKATVTTSNDIYQLSLATDYGFHASSLISAIDTSGLGFDLSVGELSGKAFSKNTGFALDLGVQFKLNEKITLDLALLDLGGKIKWTENSNYFISQGEFQYDGVTLPGADIINGSDSPRFFHQTRHAERYLQFSKNSAIV
jgi:opacity protein-like surface antigen